jgi:opacity protein-like surface antigen
MKRWLILSAATCLVLAGTAAASVQMGQVDLTASASLINENAGSRGGLNLDSWMVQAGLGYFISDFIELSAVGTFEQSRERWNMPDTDTRMLKRSVDMYLFGGQARYYFTPENQLVPYIGGQIQWADIKVKEEFNATPAANWSRDKQGVLWGPLAGLRYSLNEQNDVFVEYQYHIWEGDVGKVYDDGHGVFVGIIHQFK